MNANVSRADATKSEPSIPACAASVSINSVEERGVGAVVSRQSS